MFIKITLSFLIVVGIFAVYVVLTSVRFYRIDLTYQQGKVNGVVSFNTVGKPPQQQHILNNIQHSECLVENSEVEDGGNLHWIVIYCDQGKVKTGDINLITNHLCIEALNQAIDMVRQTQKPMTVTLSPPQATTRFYLSLIFSATFILIPLPFIFIF